MKKNFICPKCKGYLNVGESIVLAAEAKNGLKGLIHLSPEIGNYTFCKNENFEIEEGEKTDFFCPLCQKKLATDIHNNLSHIIMIDKENNEYQILFSKIAGEKSTYKVIGESIENFGEQNSNYLDFINLSFGK